MKKIPVEQREEYVKALKEKGATFPCLRCGNSDFFMSDAYFCQHLYLSDKGIACIVLGCKKCGHLDFHSPAILMEEYKKEENTNEL